MGVQRRVYQRIEWEFPQDFPARLVLFKEASGLSWNALARLLGISPSRVWEWRERGVVPSPGHLLQLLTVAESMGLLDGVLMCPDRDMPDAVKALLREVRDETDAGMRRGPERWTFETKEVV